MKYASEELVAASRIATALESIAKSLNTLAEDTKANKELKVEINAKLNQFEEVLTAFKDDPFGIK